MSQSRNRSKYPDPAMAGHLLQQTCFNDCAGKEHIDPGVACCLKKEGSCFQI